jgi:hypothetical protein
MDVISSSQSLPVSWMEPFRNSMDSWWFFHCVWLSWQDYRDMTFFSERRSSTSYSNWTSPFPFEEHPWNVNVPYSCYYTSTIYLPDANTLMNHAFEFSEVYCRRQKCALLLSLFCDFNQFPSFFLLIVARSDNVFTTPPLHHTFSQFSSFELVQSPQNSW